LGDSPRRPEPVSEIYVAQPPLSQGSATVPSMGHLLGYARVSTTDQLPQLQVDALNAAGCYRVFTEAASGARTDRPVLEQVLDQLRPGDTLVVWKLDRLGRSLRHLIDTVTGLAERGIGFRSLQEAIDTTTPGGKLVFHVFAALAEFERDLIRERTAAGLAAARARGHHGGRPSVLTAHKLRVAQELYASRQYTGAAIATTLGSAGPRSTATCLAPAADRAALFRKERQRRRGPAPLPHNRLRPDPLIQAS
jgi:DNA invertase Pin-like site-specific DNA recombinase